MGGNQKVCDFDFIGRYLTILDVWGTERGNGKKTKRNEKWHSPTDSRSTSSSKMYIEIRDLIF